ncbi:MAG TPA: indolepyruvate oxidoreductase subunit beta [Kiritimatiellia bacterium]|jgi:indolepyruvate ferredoxin oxidoreductase beta subunit|nr:indolepyruvate oxidoreductase subunit beta [Kiritimatiellia bacterium]OQC59083.1 MAG: indolepyruvate oxidoreductase subunit beta [Verrucomicrobia bacterium ADurb.Bin018]MBP9571719.1 indolepyruvate oxidoreductase subunit beta [Kiritimatiellia bacterium]HOD99962.1 indolepyruvate oxidoreductase subunit beta [Kiritimatiellia bacterium]HOE36298.1 indolepyruvate oxidoreductase subunit beta [Kiritimatiellia bacterium]
MTSSTFPDKLFNVTLVGVGGQGILLTSDILAMAAMHAGYDVKKSEVHGMSQRGGSVISQVRFGTRVHSPIIPTGETDILVSFERLEALRWAHLARPGAKILVNNMDRIPVTVSSGLQPAAQNVDERLAAYPGLILLAANELAVQAGNLRTANVVVMGALAKLVPFGEDHWQAAMRERIPAQLLDVNLRAFALGYAAIA